MKFFLSALITLLFSTFVFPQNSFDKKLNNLVLKAKVLEMQMYETNEKYPYVDLTLEITFTNEESEPIIILQPAKDFDSDFNLIFSCGISSYGINQYGTYHLQNRCALPSTCIGCNEDAAKLLDYNSPPEKYTRILKSKESFSLIEKSSFGFSFKTQNGFYGWDEVEKNCWKILGDITYSMFPINLGEYGKDFGHKLQKRWQKYGALYVGGTHSLLTSEKFEIDLTKVKFQLTEMPSVITVR